MTVALALALLSLQAATAPPTPAAPPPPAQTTTVSPLVVEAPAPAPDPEKIAADLAVVYDQSCGGRIYGTFAQACNTLAEGLARAQADARRSAKDKARKAAAAAR